MNDIAISCEKLNKTFKAGFIPKPVEALVDVSFSIPEGTVTGLLGPNGSGKSTFIKTATEFISPSSGRVTFFGGQEFSEVKSLVGYVPEKPHYATKFSGLEILKFHASLTNESDEKINDIIDLVGLSNSVKRAFGTYSKGMRQRLAIGQALLSDPKLLILDEPLSGLDPDGREALIQVILSYSKRENKTVVLSSHLLEDLQRICNNLVVLNKGKLVFSGDPSVVFKPEGFQVSFRKKGVKIFTEKVLSAKLNGFLENLISSGSEIISVEPETQSVSSLYFKAIKGELLDG